MSVIEDVRKLFQDFLAPELRAIRGEIAIVSERVKSFEEKADLRFKYLDEKMDFHYKAIMKELATDKRIERLEQLVVNQEDKKVSEQ